jgi:hypothetical protein
MWYSATRSSLQNVSVIVQGIGLAHGAHGDRVRDDHARLEDSYTDNVEDVAVHVSVKGDAVGVVSADGVGILDAN